MIQDRHWSGRREQGRSRFWPHLAANGVTWGPVDLQVPHLDSLKPPSLSVALTAALLLFRAKWSVLRTLGACALADLAAGVVELLAT